MSPNVITTVTDLESFVERISPSPWLAMDTEFLRESTYYPILCLIQIATDETSACIDVLSIDHIDPLLKLLRQSSQLKIFHSCRQDLEVLFSEYQFIPQPLFDTQVAASILGLDEQISYAELVSQKSSVHLAKTESRTDWKKRPLTAAQINYALDDVIHLGPLYKKLEFDLEEENRTPWQVEECEKLLLTSNYFVAPDEAWKQIKGIGKLNAEQFYYVRKIAYWREQSAQTKNLPRRWILPDPAILETCQLKDLSRESISQCLKEHAPKSIRHSSNISKILQQSIPDDIVDNLQEPSDNRLSKEQRALIKKLMAFTRNRADQINTSASLLANRKSLVNLVLGKQSRLDSGWRKSLIGDELATIVASEPK
ncbi:MAG: ribonuclease D [Gammaproteobacteria bacterium]|nr:ribonuclease D [Gammaproteobacteria bacterium]